MAVEFRCPDCRAKLRLAEAPPPGEEIECPRCGTVFPTPAERPAAEDEPKPKKKKAPVAEDGGKPKPKPGGEGTKRRKTKKKKSNPAVLVGAIVGGVAAVGLLVVMLVFLLGKQPAAMALMAYLPDDTDHASGVNFAQFQKYPLFYKGFAQMFDGPQGTKKRFEPVSKALGTEFDALVDYFVEGGKSTDSSTALIRTKKEFDAGLLAKMPGTREETINGIKVYTIADPLRPGSQVRVFAPTNRIVVLASSLLSADALHKMVVGNKESKEASFVGRVGSFGARVTKGNLWELQLTGGGAKGRLAAALVPTLFGTAKSDSPTDKGYDVGPLKGSGGRMTIGAQTFRFELVLWCESATQASEDARKWNDSELAKGDEGTPPMWWKNFLTEVLGDRTLAPAVTNALGFSASGDLFLIKTAVDVKKGQDKLPGWAERINPKPPEKK